MTPRPSALPAPAVSPSEAIEEAIASTRLEGLDLPAEFLEDAALVASGEISIDEFRARTDARLGR